ncbi:5-formyltetrahydrofolate cyclo-ligase [Sphingobacterium sp. SGL-16]|uniref:5-formyltetrahydrofolate cyclo-ligase n=1 Tax=Sphingobacterium sp. SGL-16 TaxID=2710883 RepID=UPI0013EE2AF2|nr:5-formyltetrahydrofolate cyclo-ligase [Sphingobacterium sp. SGL-16]NGM72474.1 5-formyltetrahydrofolate cyclo-ligase [Sphingobacterium sp. SGL-16]
MTKSELRKEYKKRRNNLSIQDQATLNDQLFEKLRMLDWEKYTYVHVYLTLEKFNEPDTIRLIKWLREFHPHIQLVISKSDFTNGSMQNYILNDKTELIENAYGILEPVKGELVDEILIDLAFVPLLVIDIKGNRVGYGKGFYDRFLSKCRTDIKSYGLSFFEPVQRISDVEKWDRRLTHCITPLNIYSFQ